MMSSKVCNIGSVSTRSLRGSAEEGAGVEVVAPSADLAVPHLEGAGERDGQERLTRRVEQMVDSLRHHGVVGGGDRDRLDPQADESESLVERGPAGQTPCLAYS